MNFTKCSSLDLQPHHTYIYTIWNTHDIRGMYHERWLSIKWNETSDKISILTTVLLDNMEILHTITSTHSIIVYGISGFTFTHERALCVVTFFQCTVTCISFTTLINIDFALITLPSFITCTVAVDMVTWYGMVRFTLAHTGTVLSKLALWTFCKSVRC